MKKFAFLLVLSALLLLLISCGGKTPAPQQDSAATQAAETAYAAFAAENSTTRYMLYEHEGQFVALCDGTAAGAYESKELAMAALFDDPDTEKNEAGTYLSLPVSGSAWHLCCADFRGKTYVAFGDSITYGIDGNFRSGDANYRMAYPYPSLVGDTLGMSAVRNEAISGASFCPHPQRANMTEKILGFFGEADVISLMLGVNDFTSQLPLGEPTDRDNTTIYGCLHLISAYLTENYPDAFLFYMTPFQYTNPDNGTYKLEDVANAIKTVAAEYDIPVLDMYNEGRYELEMFVAPNDGIHPSQQHHTTYTAPLIAEFIAKHYPSS